MIMIWLLRAGAYAISSFAIWNFFQGSSFGDPSLVKHLALDQGHSMLLGVCAGFSNYTGLDVTLIRLVWALSSFYRGIGIGIYMLAFFLMPPS